MSCIWAPRSCGMSPRSRSSKTRRREKERRAPGPPFVFVVGELCAFADAPLGFLTAMIRNTRLFSGRYHRGLAAFTLLLLAGCASSPPHAVAPPEDHTVRVPPNAGVYKVGDPYQIDNIWYYP